MIQRDFGRNMKTMSSIKMANKSFIRIRKDGDDDEREVKWFCRSFSSPSPCYDNIRYPGPSDRVISPLESFRRSAWCVPIINIIMEHQNQHRQIIKSFLMTGRDLTMENGREEIAVQTRGGEKVYEFVSVPIKDPIWLIIIKFMHVSSDAR